MASVNCRRRLLACVSATAISVNALHAGRACGSAAGRQGGNTATPIKHLIVIYGENRSFDHLFATYMPQHGETVMNLLSQGIVDELGAPGPNFDKAAQFQATDTTKYSIAPTKTSAYATLPPPNTGCTPTVASDTKPPPFATVALAGTVDYGLLPRDFRLLTTGASGLPQGAIDTRIENVDTLPNGPFQLTPGVPYDAYADSPVHRFYQAWQQSDCDASHATRRQSERLSQRPVSLGRGDGRRRQQRPAAARRLQ